MGKILKKIVSWQLLGHLLAMALLLVGLIVGVSYALDAYTHHGESIAIPDVKHHPRADAEAELRRLGLEVTVSDTGYVKSLPADCVLELSPSVGSHVKSGHMVYLVVNASKSPTLVLPDLVDNSSLREAMARLTAQGFKLGLPEYVSGEKDWVYGMKADGRNVQGGDRVSVESRITIVVGSGLRDESDSIDYVIPEQPDYEAIYGIEEDDFEVVD